MQQFEKHITLNWLSQANQPELINLKSHNVFLIRQYWELKNAYTQLLSHIQNLNQVSTNQPNISPILQQSINLLIYSKEENCQLLSLNQIRLKQQIDEMIQSDQDYFNSHSQRQPNSNKREKTIEIEDQLIAVQIQELLEEEGLKQLKKPDDDDHKQKCPNNQKQQLQVLILNKEKKELVQWKEQFILQKTEEIQAYQMKIDDLESVQVEQQKVFKSILDEKLGLLYFIVDKLCKEEHGNDYMHLNQSQTTLQKLLDQVDRKVQDEIYNTNLLSNEMTSKSNNFDQQSEYQFQMIKNLTQSSHKQRQKYDGLIDQNLGLKRELEKINHSQGQLQNQYDEMKQMIVYWIDDHSKQLTDKQNEIYQLINQIAQTVVETDLIKFGFTVKIKRLTDELDEHKLVQKAHNDYISTLKLNEKQYSNKIDSLRLNIDTIQSQIIEHIDETTQTDQEAIFNKSTPIQKQVKIKPICDIEIVLKKNFSYQDPRLLPAITAATNKEVEDLNLQVQAQMILTKDANKLIEALRIKINTQCQDFSLKIDGLHLEQTVYQKELKETQLRLASMSEDKKLSQEKLIQNKQEQYRQETAVNQLENLLTSRNTEFQMLQKVLKESQEELLHIKDNNKSLANEKIFLQKQIQILQINIQSRIKSMTQTETQTEPELEIDIEPQTSEKFQYLPSLNLECFEKNQISPPTELPVPRQMIHLNLKLVLKQLDDERSMLLPQKVDYEKYITPTPQVVQSNNSILAPRYNSVQRNPSFKIQKCKLSRSQIECRLITDYDRSVSSESTISPTKNSHKSHIKLDYLLEGQKVRRHF